ncbi:MAG: hypothetical protein JSW52_09155 [Candidatus Coatesbacteria bacterium]|nr:MAG: hypothetical protein JSW52_09155 [Candidatus Coatesbacteria bacterium]
MAIDDIEEARKLADELAAELVAGLDAEALEDAKSMGLATSMFSAEIEEYRAKFNAAVSAEIAEQELFDIAVAKALR